MTEIKALNPSGEIKTVAVYSLEAKQSLINFIMQKKGNYNWWEYPTELDGVRQSNTKIDTYFFDDGDICYGAFPRKEVRIAVC